MGLCLALKGHTEGVHFSCLGRYDVDQGLASPVQRPPLVCTKVKKNKLLCEMASGLLFIFRLFLTGKVVGGNSRMDSSLSHCSLNEFLVIEVTAAENQCSEPASGEDGEVLASKQRL